MSGFDGVSLDGFIVWVKERYDEDPGQKVTVRFLLEVLRPELLTNQGDSKND